MPGLVHDTSASGATVFIEPMSVVEANNEIRVLQSQELEEINRILRELSAEAGEFAESIIQSFHYAVELNLIFAKAQVAYRMKAATPKLTEDGVILLHAARHPLIDKEKVVPTDISLGRDFDSLIITGPNTGGKTVALKTTGLLTLMAMCGLMIPAAEGSQISVFTYILADIGDEQSIEQSLSTFSAHMTNIISILGVANGRSLVLLDELGAGTDPVEGAALATAIIEELRRSAAGLHHPLCGAESLCPANRRCGKRLLRVRRAEPAAHLPAANRRAGQVQRLCHFPAAGLGGPHRGPGRGADFPGKLRV